MGEYILIGKIVDTHGIKGELRIVSDFYEKKLVFKKGFSLYITPLYHEEVINTYRTHKHYDMVTFNNYDNINQVLKYKGMNVYIKREDLGLEEDEYLFEDLVNFEVVEDDRLVGKVIDINNNGSILFKVKGEKIFYIPNVSDFIINIDVKNKKIIVKNIGGLMI